jgi:hypothetical protein
MSPQFTYDSNGNTIGVFLPIEDWKQIQKKLPIDNADLPLWQKEILDHRLSVIAQDPNSVMPLEDFIAEMEHEANEAI